MYRNFLKRIIDLLVSITGLIILSPVFILLTVVFFVSNHGKPFFFQRRPGKDEKIFRVVKFKTMNDRKDKSGELLPDRLRTTCLGNFARKSSLDEIPQLLNVVMGQMSLVGPRPLLIEYLSYYNQRQRKRHSVRPGITGWAQVNGRNAISWEQKFEFDTWYVEHLSFALDCKILLLTIRKIFAAEDINFSESITMTKFRGTKIDANT